MWQVQIYNTEVDEWYAWAHTEYNEADKADAQRAARVARRFGWKTRVVLVKE